MAYKLVTLPGDGIGPEVMAQGLRVLQSVSDALSISWEIKEIPCGGKYYLEHGSRDWPEGSEQLCADADMLLLGAVGWPSPHGNGPVTMRDGKMAGYSPVIGNRTKLDLYANVRPVRLYEGVSHRVHGRHQQVWQPGNVDMVIVRENTEGLYAGMGGQLSPGDTTELGIDTRVITRRGCDRVIRYAFELCKRRNKGAPRDGELRVTAIVKDNVLRGDQLFRDRFFAIGQEYPEIEQETAIVDAFTQWLVCEPERYDVCVTTNMFGDIVTDLASVLQGGMGMAASANVGDRHGMFEPIHGSSPPDAGHDRLNPIATVLSVKEGLEWLSGQRNDPALSEAARAIETAVVELLRDGAPLTQDLVGPTRAARCSEVGNVLATRAAAHCSRRS